jgi:hypothetical protein
MIFAYPDIRHDDINATERPHGFFDHFTDGIMVGHVADDRQDLAGIGSDRRRRLVQSGFIAMAIDRDLGAGRGEASGDRAANIAARTGDQRDPPVQTDSIRRQHW